MYVKKKNSPLRGKFFYRAFCPINKPLYLKIFCDIIAVFNWSIVGFPLKREEVATMSKKDIISLIFQAATLAVAI